MRLLTMAFSLPQTLCVITFVLFPAASTTFLMYLLKI